MNTDENVFRDTSKMEKILTMALWKLCGREPVELTLEDLKKFDAEFGGEEAQLVVHAHMDGLRLTVMDHATAMDFVEKYKQDNRGIVTGG